MNAKPEMDCSDPLYRLSVYEAGHALIAWALGHDIVSVRMLPRPPETVTEKIFTANDWASFYEVLEFRGMELFGGQIAESMLCGATTCCSGDVSRIDEITRILAGINGEEDHEDIFFRLEDQTKTIFADERYRNAIEPVAQLLFEREVAGQLEIPGKDIEAVIQPMIPRAPKAETGVSRLFGLLKRRA